MRQLKKVSAITDRRSETIEMYLRDVNRYPLISADEEVELSRQIQQGGRVGQRAKQKLVEANLRFVISVANQYTRHGIELADLIEEGNMGLLRAAETFDDTRGFKFTSYAVWWIRQAIMQAFSEQMRLIKVPGNVQNMMFGYWRMNDEMLQSEGRQLSPEEFAEKKGLSARQLKAFKRALVKTVSASKPIADDNEKTIESELVAEQEKDHLEYQYLGSELKSVLACLNKTEFEVITKTFGIGCDEMSLSSAAMEIGLTRERVRQIRARALVKMQGVNGIKALREYL